MQIFIIYFLYNYTFYRVLYVISVKHGSVMVGNVYQHMHVHVLLLMLYVQSVTETAGVTVGHSILITTI